MAQAARIPLLVFRVLTPVTQSYVAQAAFIVWTGALALGTFIVEDAVEFEQYRDASTGVAGWLLDFPVTSLSFWTPVIFLAGIALVFVLRRAIALTGSDQQDIALKLGASIVAAALATARRFPELARSSDQTCTGAAAPISSS